MEPNRGLGHKPTSLWSTELQQGYQEHKMEKGQSL
jgi:hypothetical protein